MAHFSAILLQSKLGGADRTKNECYFSSFIGFGFFTEGAVCDAEIFLFALKKEADHKGDHSSHL